ncbi:MAG: LPS export ABC transporter ATP-binding protein [Candidatus Neomarinimicrobiota bacterium]|tara:strand:- start:2901 stop:3641 length:741 start_codon:yes stop_codon:yes gene_type:complete
MSQKVVHINNLKKKYGQREVVSDVSMVLNKGEIIGLLGPNGAGKTTTFYMITGMVKVSAGNIKLNDLNITNMSMDKRARLGLGYLAQEPSIFTDLSVEDNLKLVLEFSDLDKTEQKYKLDELLEDFSIGHIRKSIAKHLSGGERRRTEIARALILNPDFILLDEPFAGIDPIAVEDIQQIIMKLKNNNIGILITDHNVRETLSITDRSYLIFDGAILKSGSSKELAEDSVVRDKYLGKNFKLEKHD